MYLLKMYIFITSYWFNIYDMNKKKKKNGFLFCNALRHFDSISLSENCKKT